MNNNEERGQWVDGRERSRVKDNVTLWLCELLCIVLASAVLLLCVLSISGTSLDRMDYRRRKHPERK